MDDPVLNRVRQRLWRENKNWLAAIYGETGSGKSYTAITMAFYIDHGFSIDKVFFSCKDFIHALNQGLLKKGSCAILDEAGISFGNDAQKTQKPDLFNIRRRIDRIIDIFHKENDGQGPEYAQ